MTSAGKKPGTESKRDFVIRGWNDLDMFVMRPTGVRKWRSNDGENTAFESEISSSFFASNRLEGFTVGFATCHTLTTGRGPQTHGTNDFAAWI
jgi:hypothetical protein